MYAFEFLSSLPLIFFRVLPIFLFIPVFSPTSIPNTYVRGAFILIICLPMTDFIQVHNDFERSFFEIFVYELVIGMFLAIPAALPFWIANTIGEIIDNQRGATLSNTIDPSVGVESSPLSSFFLFFTNMLFLLSPGVLILIQAISNSYTVFPFAVPYNLIEMDFNRLYEILDISLLAGTVFVLPVLIVMFLTEVFLGILSRFSPQMNSFSLSLTIKSFVGIATLFLYFQKIYPAFIMEYFYYVR